MGHKIHIQLSEEVDEFLSELQPNVKRKILANIKRVSDGEQNIEIFKKIEGTEIWEFRTTFSKMEYRILAFWDKNTNSLVVTTHGFVKKTQKTPKKEIDKAERIRIIYYNQHKIDERKR